MTTTLPATTVPTVANKLDQLEAELNFSVFERTAEIETAVTGLVSVSHHLQVGPPGTGKTYMIDQLSKFIDMQSYGYFRWLMTRFSVPEELFGPISLKAMENDEYKRNTTNKLPEAKLVFLDEFFKSNSALLNALLTIMNEGLYFNNGHPQACKPIIFSGSNELPRETELAALWDRVSFRHEVKRLQNNDSRLAMLMAKANRNQPKAAIVPVITWSEIEQAQWDASLVEVPSDVGAALIELWVKMDKAMIEPSDRRYSDFIPIIQATAYRAGRTVCEIEDLRLLRHAAWINTSDIDTVNKLILEMANPLDSVAMKLIGDVDNLAAEVQKLLKSTDNDTQRRRAGVGLQGKIKRLKKDLDDLQGQARKGTKRSSMIEEANTRLKALITTLLTDLFHVDAK